MCVGLILTHDDYKLEHMHSLHTDNSKPKFLHLLKLRFSEKAKNDEISLFFDFTKYMMSKKRW